MVYKEENLMNRRNWLSALLAVMMVISMMTCIALPAVAEIDYTMLPYASTATRYDGVSAYQINSVGELIRTNMALRMRGADATGYASGSTNRGMEGTTVTSGDTRLVIWNFEETDTIYLTADLDTANWSDWKEFATYDEVTGLYTPNKIGASIQSANFVYVDNDGTYTNGQVVTCATLQELFNVLYNGFAWGWQVWAGYAVQNFTFDGLSHTIKNYSDNHPFFFGNFTGYINNLTFESANVTPIAGGFAGGKSTASLLVCGTNYTTKVGSSFAGVTMTNVHIKDSTLNIPAEWVGGGFFMAEANNVDRQLNLRNCSLTGSTINNAVNTLDDASASSAANTTARVGLVMGYRNGIVTVNNCVFANNAIVSSADAAPSGILFGAHSNYAGDIKFTVNNVTLANNRLIAANLQEADTAIVMFADNFGDWVNISNVYSYGNTVATSQTATPVAISSLVATNAGNYVANVSIDAATIATDAAVANLLNDKKNSSQVENNNKTLTGVQDALDKMNDNLNPEESKWKLDDSGAIVSVEPLKMTFEFVNGSTKVLYSDAHGKYKVDDATRALLVAEDWVDEYDVPTVLDYDNLSSEEDVTYYMIPHALRYVGNGDQTHNIVCDKCDEHDEVNVACTPVEDPENDVLPGYFTPASKAYTCKYCTNTWVVPLSSDECPAPYTLTFDKVDYYNNGSEILLTLAAESDANLNALTVDITFPAENMAYVSYVPADGYMATVNTKDAASGKLSVTLAKMDGTTLTAADVAVLKFTAQGVDEANATAFVSAEAEVTALIVDEGNTSVKKMPENKFASDNAVITYLVIGDFIAGDINSDGSVTLLDAALLIQKMNGTIHPKQDGANFMVLAADVNNDGVADTGDVVLLLRVATLMEVNLVKATEIPVIAYVE